MKTEPTVRVAYLTGEYPRATDTWIQREIASLRRAGVDVDTFAIRPPGDEHMVGPEQKAERDRVSYILPNCKSPKLLANHLQLFRRSPKRYLGALKLALSTKRAGIKGGAYQLFYFAEAGYLAAELQSRQIRHLHNHFGDSSCTVAMLAAELADIDFSFTLHGPGIFFEPKTWRLDQKISKAAFVACISFFCRSQAAIFAQPDDVKKLHIIHCGVDSERLAPVEHSGRGSNVTFVARLAELKGVSDLLHAIRKLSVTYPAVRLTIIGDGPERRRFENLSRQLKVDSLVTFAGYQSQAEVAAQLQETAILVLPSYAEGVPVTLMEALTCQVPVIASQVGGVTELVKDGVNGFVVRPGDIDQLAGKLETLLSDGALRQRFGTAGRELTTKEFENDTEALRLRLLFENSMAGLESATRPEV